jgi:hypothetical protein
MVAAVAGATILAYTLWPSSRRRRRKDEEEFQRYVEPVRMHWAIKVGLLALPLILAASIVIAVYRFQIVGTAPTAQSPAPKQGAPITLPPGAQPVPGASEGAEGANLWVPLLAAAILLSTVAGVIWWFLQRREHALVFEEVGSAEPLRPALESELAAVLDKSLDDLRQEGDPRRAVIAAYAAMERLLARHGLARRSVETPSEYAARVVQALGLSAEALSSLTSLFELARFSHHVIRSEMQERAIADVTAIRREVSFVDRSSLS